MVWILVIVAIGLFFGAFLLDDNCWDVCSLICRIFAGIFVGCSICVLLWCVDGTIEASQSEPTIKNLEQSNTIIEININNIIKEYNEEKENINTYEFNENTYQLFNYYYFELTNNVNVNEMIKTYENNLKEIKQCKPYLDNKSNYHWWLYFGK